MKKLLLTVLFFLANFAHAGTPCLATPTFGIPTDSKTNVVTMCRKAYILQEDEVAKIPSWVAYTLTPKETVGCVPRSNAFKADGDLSKGQRSEKSDYAKSGYDIGHIANDADMSWNPDVEKESFLLSNMAPQLPEFNRGIWKVLESDVRAWAYSRNHELVVYAGPIYDSSKDKTIGADKVVVADGFYKIVVDTQTKETLAFIFPHKGAPDANLVPFLTSVSAVEKATGITFPVPSDKSKVGNLWQTDLKSVAAEKKKECAK